MEVKLYKWANVLETCQDDLVMLKAFRNFQLALRYCDWETPADIMMSFNSADTLTCKGMNFNRIVFNVGGNKFRMICGYKFGKHRVLLYARFVGAHSEYDDIDVCKVNLYK
jgi:mRNA interferase HigB